MILLGSLAAREEKRPVVPSQLPVLRAELRKPRRMFSVVPLETASRAEPMSSLEAAAIAREPVRLAELVRLTVPALTVRVPTLREPERVRAPVAALMSEPVPET